MKKHLFILVYAFVFFVHQTAFAAHYIVCKSKYALCTTAKCYPIVGKKDLVSCDCEVKTGYSAGMKNCENETKTKNGMQIKSRYYPIKSYMTCSNEHPWAWCLDKSCIIDKDNPAKAHCFCSLVKNLGDYIIVTDKYSQSMCTTGIISSATLKGANQLTEFLETQKNLRPSKIKVLNK